MCDAHVLVQLVAPGPINAYSIKLFSVTFFVSNFIVRGEKRQFVCLVAIKLRGIQSCNELPEAEFESNIKIAPIPMLSNTNCPHCIN